MPLGNLLEHVGTEPFPEFYHPASYGRKDRNVKTQTILIIEDFFVGVATQDHMMDRP